MYEDDYLDANDLEPTDHHGRTSGDFDSDCGDYEPSHPLMLTRNEHVSRASACALGIAHHRRCTCTSTTRGFIG